MNPAIHRQGDPAGGGHRGRRPVAHPGGPGPRHRPRRRRRPGGADYRQLRPDGDHRAAHAAHRGFHRRERCAPLRHLQRHRHRRGLRDAAHQRRAAPARQSPRSSARPWGPPRRASTSATSCWNPTPSGGTFLPRSRRTRSSPCRTPEGWWCCQSRWSRNSSCPHGGPQRQQRPQPLDLLPGLHQKRGLQRDLLHLADRGHQSQRPGDFVLHPQPGCSPSGTGGRATTSPSPTPPPTTSPSSWAGPSSRASPRWWTTSSPPISPGRASPSPCSPSTATGGAGPVQRPEPVGVRRPWRSRGWTPSPSCGGTTAATST